MSTECIPIDLKYKRELLKELDEIVINTDSIQGYTGSIKTPNYFLYSVSNPHNNGAFTTLRDFLLKDRLMTDNSNLVLEMKILLSYQEYSRKRDRFLSNLEAGDFLIKEPRKRDIFLSWLRNRNLKEIIYGNKISVAFYEGKCRNSRLEFFFDGNLKLFLDKIRCGLEVLLEH